jgi:hypothetical protein
LNWQQLLQLRQQSDVNVVPQNASSSKLEKSDCAIKNGFILGVSFVSAEAHL